MSGTGVLADRKVQTASLNFRRYNLVYGFNGSGKSTLSRTFASLQAGKLAAKLPAGCSFEFELSDGSTLKSGDGLGGLEKNVLVFNEDFIEENFRWSEGAANPVSRHHRWRAEGVALAADRDAAVLKKRLDLELLPEVRIRLGQDSEVEPAASQFRHRGWEREHCGREHRGVRSLR